VAPDAPAGAGTARLAALGFAVLLVATFGAFFLASRLKAQPAELSDLKRVKYFSPNGDGRRDIEPIDFRVDLDDEAAVDIVDADGARVRRIMERLPIRPDRTMHVRWNGRDDEGRVAPDGVYRMRLILRGEGRSILAGKAFNLDTRPPDPAVIVDRRTPIVAPGSPVRFRVRGAGATSRPRFRVLRTDVTPIRTVRDWRGRRGRHSFTWDGADGEGRPVPPGTYLIAVTARDKARNAGTGPPLPPAPASIEGRPGVTVRSLAVQPPVRPVRAGELVAFRVDARGRRYGWSVRRLGTGRSAVAGRRPKRSTTLLVRAPRGPSGVYLLEVSSHGARTSVPFAVQTRAASRPGRPLVVLPVISWLGRDPVDDSSTHDGLPDTFTNGSPVTYPRLYAFDGGLPSGFARDVAPLLVWMDRNDLAYDITTDLALSLSADQPKAADRKGLLLAGAPEWVSRGLARRLRRYVADGGRVALFGPRALRAGVTVGDRRLTRPTVAGPADAFGGRLSAVREVAPGPDGVRPPLSVLGDDPDLGLLEGFSGELPGFSRVEELISAGPRGEVVAQVGAALTEAEAAQAEADDESPRPERAAFSAVRDGKGLVVRVGLPEWVDRLGSKDATVEQLTFNVIDLLRGARPRPRSAG
jgi:flagellar hook assembly protein FlgD